MVWYRVKVLSLRMTYSVHADSSVSVHSTTHTTTSFHTTIVSCIPYHHCIHCMVWWVLVYCMVAKLCIVHSTAHVVYSDSTCVTLEGYMSATVQLLHTVCACTAPRVVLLHTNAGSTSWCACYAVQVLTGILWIAPLTYVSGVLRILQYAYLVLDTCRTVLG